jgi:hypothetical protein
MTLADLLFLLVALATLLTLGAAALMAVSGRRSASLRTLTVLAGGVAGYVVVGLAVALLRPQRVLSVGDPLCFDDWCLTVTHASVATGASGTTWTVDLRLSSVARRVSQRARGAWVFMIDDRGRRYATDADPSALPLDVLLGPGESVTTSRAFHVPSDAGSLGLVTGHGGPYCGPMDLLVIGAAGCVFHKPTMIRIR